MKTTFYDLSTEDKRVVRESVTTELQKQLNSCLPPDLSQPTHKIAEWLSCYLPSRYQPFSQQIAALYTEHGYSWFDKVECCPLRQAIDNDIGTLIANAVVVTESQTIKTVVIGNKS